MLDALAVQLLVHKKYHATRNITLFFEFVDQLFQDHDFLPIKALLQ